MYEDSGIYFIIGLLLWLTRSEMVECGHVKGDVDLIGLLVSDPEETAQDGGSMILSIGLINTL